MRLIKKLFFILFLLILYINIYSIDYYICLGSFLDNDNAIEYSINLNKVGINTVHEKTKIKNKYFTRVLLNIKFRNLKDAITELNKLLNNKVIKKENIRDLWIRPGKLFNVQKIDKTKLSSNQKNREIKEKEKIVKIESKPEKEESKEKIPLEELDEEKVSEKEEKPITDENKFRIIDNEGYANCIFASQPIEFAKEDSYELKTIFNKPEKVYARCYFPKNIGKLESQNFWHEIWINGKFIRRTVFTSPPDPNWDQIQIWISEDDYSDIINSLEKGEYKIIIWILKNEIIKEKDKTEVKTIKLSKGEFTYIVP